MTAPSPRLLAAEANAAAARARLAATVDEAKVRLEPRSLARTAGREMQHASANAARIGAQTAQRNPRLVFGTLAAVVLLLGRRRIAGLFRRQARDETADAYTSLIANTPDARITP